MSGRLAVIGTHDCKSSTALVAYIHSLYERGGKHAFETNHPLPTFQEWYHGNQGLRVPWQQSCRSSQVLPAKMNVGPLSYRLGSTQSEAAPLSWCGTMLSQAR